MITAGQVAPAKSIPKVFESLDPVFRQIRDLVYKASGIFQLEGKLYLLSDACGRRMKMLGVRSPREYWHLLTGPGHAAELRQLLNEITIGETCLFRSQPQVEALRGTLDYREGHDGGRVAQGQKQTVRMSDDQGVR